MPVIVHSQVLFHMKNRGPYDRLSNRNVVVGFRSHFWRCSNDVECLALETSSLT